MSLRNTNSKSGFTIVELLIVIVVIAILAAITIVSYNGVTARANTTSAKAAASTVIKKIEIYNADKTAYPTTTAALTGAAQSEAFYLSGVTIGTEAIAAAPSAPATVTIFRCPGTGTITGMLAQYWKYDGTAAAQTLGTGTGLPTTANTTTGCTALAS